MGVDYPEHLLAREPAPPYEGEGPFALWHFSEDPSLGRFRPQAPAADPEAQPLVWAVDTRHAPMFWFPRDCPRGCIWPVSATTPEDRERFFGQGAANRVHVIEAGWLNRMRACRLYAYRLPAEAFRPHEVGGYWVLRSRWKRSSGWLSTIFWASTPGPGSSFGSCRQSGHSGGGSRARPWSSAAPGCATQPLTRTGSASADPPGPHSMGWVTARMRDGGGLVGFVNVAWDGGDHAFLLDTKVASEHQRQGIGAALARPCRTACKGGRMRVAARRFRRPPRGVLLRRLRLRPTHAGLIHLPRGQK